MDLQLSLCLLNFCQLPIGISFALRFRFTVSLNLSLGLPIPREPSQSWEYRICLGSLPLPILWTCPDHLRFLCISISYILIMLVFSSTVAFVTKSHHFRFRIWRSWHIIYAFSLCAATLYTVVSSMLIHTLSLSLPKAFEAFEVQISSSASSLLLLLMVEPRYLNFVTSLSSSS